MPETEAAANGPGAGWLAQHGVEFLEGFAAGLGHGLAIAAITWLLFKMLERLWPSQFGQRRRKRPRPREKKPLP